MLQDPAFFAAAFKTVRTYLAETSSRSGPPRKVLAEIRARLKVALTLLRRLMFLMAIQSGLPDVPVPDRAGVETKAGRARPAPDATGSVKVGLAPALVRLKAASLPSLMEDRDKPHAEAQLKRLMDRLILLYRIAARPEDYVSRLAGTLARQRAAGAGAPVCAPLPHEHRLAPDIGLLAGALQVQVSRAAAAWHETG